MGKAIDDQSDTGAEGPSLTVRVKKLEAQLKQVYRPIVTERLPALDSRLSETENTVAALRKEIETLEARVETLVGVPDDAASTHEKRVQDTRQILLRRAEAATSDRASMYWREIAVSLADHGHGELYETQVKRVMDDVVKADGYTMGRGKRDVSQTDTRTDVREVQLVRCEAAAVPGIDASNSVVDGTPEVAPTKAQSINEPHDTNTD